MSELFKALVRLPQNHAAQSSVHLLAQKKIEAFRLRHLFSICKALRISIEDVEVITPCTPLQEGIISRSLGSDTPIYFEEFTFELPPEIDIERLKHAWIRVTDSTHILRTRLYPTADGYAQIVCKEIQLPWYYYNFASQEELENFRISRYHTWWTKHRELATSLFEVLIFQSCNQRLMCLHIFHALYDGQSIVKIFQNLQLEYNQASNVEYGPLYHETLAYGPLGNVDGAEEFWKSRLNGLSYEALPKLPAKSASSVTLELPHISMDKVRKQYDTTDQSIIQAAWLGVLRKHYPSQITFGMVISGRSMDVKDVDKVMGPLFNTVPVHVNIEGCTSWGEVIGRCHDFNTAFLPYQHSSLRDVMKWCQRSPESPFFETLFVFQKEAVNNSTNTQQLWTRIEGAPQADVS